MAVDEAFFVEMLPSGLSIIYLICWVLMADLKSRYEVYLIASERELSWARYAEDNIEDSAAYLLVDTHSRVGPFPI